jgi:hypothetical protein
MERSAETEKSVWLPRGLVLAVALIAGLGALIASRGDEQAEPPTTSTARVVTEQDLAEIGAEAGHPVYWAGEKEGSDLSAIEGEDGSIEVRYVEDGALAESGIASFPTVITYPIPDPGAALARYAARRDSVVHRSGEGREVVSSEDSPTSAYFVSPDDRVQVEVYDPVPGRALSVALGAQVQPAG